MSSILTPARIETIATRQFPPKYGSDYIPSILANRAEAPVISRPSIRYSKFLNREMHALSISELKAIVLAIRHPRLIDAHENPAYALTPGPHPFADHPAAANLRLPTTSGTLTIADALGTLKLHPKVLSRARSNAIDTNETNMAEDETIWDPAFYITDLRLMMVDEQGIYGLDWDIKLNDGDHGKPGPGKRSLRALRRAEARAQVTGVFNAELGIRSVQFVGNDIDHNVFCNLNQLMGWHDYDLGKSADEVQEFEDDVRGSMKHGIAPLSMLGAWTARGWKREQFLAALWQSIWYQRVRVDLFRPVVVNHPLRPEVRCIFDVYAHLFHR